MPAGYVKTRYPGIFRRDGVNGTTYLAVVAGGVGPDGKRMQIRRTHKTLREARDWQTRTRHELRSGTYSEPTRELTGDYLSRWLEYVDGSERRDSTLLLYERVVRDYLVPAFGAVPLARLSTEPIDHWLTELRRRGLSPRTQQIYFGVLRQALAQARRWKLIPLNPCDDVTRPTLVKRPPTIWSPAQAHQFLAATEREPEYPIWLLAVYCGLRRGELLALGWADLDLDAGLLTVRQTLTDTRSGIGIGPAKTEAGQRPLALVARIVTALRRHRAAQHERRLILGPDWIESHLVFDRGDGRYRNPRGLSDVFQRQRARAGLPAIRLHDLRHVMSTTAAGAGVPPTTIQAMMGHSSFEITSGVYIHASLDDLRLGAERVARAFEQAR